MKDNELETMKGAPPPKASEMLDTQHREEVAQAAMSEVHSRGVGMTPMYPSFKAPPINFGQTPDRGDED